jgi:hypothetical protein
MTTSADPSDPAAVAWIMMLLPLMPRGARDPGYADNPAICSPPCRPPSEQPGGDKQRGKSAGQPDSLDGKRLEALLVAEVHGGTDVRHRAARRRIPQDDEQQPGRDERPAPDQDEHRRTEERGHGDLGAEGEPQLG